MKSFYCSLSFSAPLLVAKVLKVGESIVLTVITTSNFRIVNVVVRNQPLLKDALTRNADGGEENHGLRCATSLNNYSKGLDNL